MASYRVGAGRPAPAGQDKQRREAGGAERQWCLTRVACSVWTALADFLVGSAPALLTRSIARVPLLDMVLNAGLRAVSQVFLLSNPLAGAVVWLALAATSPVHYTVLTAAAVASATLSARCMGAPAAEVRAGLYGLSSMLFGAALATFLVINADAVSGSEQAQESAVGLLSSSVGGILGQAGDQASSPEAAEAARPASQAAMAGLRAGSGSAHSPGTWPPVSSLLPSAAGAPGTGPSLGARTPLVAAIGLAVFGAVLIVVLTRAMSNTCRATCGLPPLTVPFNVVTALVLLAVAATDPRERAGPGGSERSLRQGFHVFTLQPGIGAHPGQGAAVSAMDALVLAQVAVFDAAATRQGREAGWLGFCDGFASAAQPDSAQWGDAPTGAQQWSASVAARGNATALARGATWQAEAPAAGSAAAAAAESSFVVRRGEGSRPLTPDEASRLRNASLNLLALPPSDVVTRIPGTALCVNESAVRGWSATSNASLGVAEALHRHSLAVIAVERGGAGAGWEAYTGPTGEGLVLATLRGVSQVYFNPSWEAGFVISVALAISSPVSAAAAVGGSLVGAMVGMLLGAPAAAVTAGLWGPSSALAAVSMAGIFYRLEEVSVFMAALAAATAGVATAACLAGLSVVGLPPLTFPAPKSRSGPNHASQAQQRRRAAKEAAWGTVAASPTGKPFVPPEASTRYGDVDSADEDMLEVEHARRGDAAEP
ncbi:hypothetical protein FNF29_07032 [Cafeteria roenbergensis]|uniref:Uncharacterized protein n=1 Tax=Cafeteria roenbergensis TaxID=33653 RepID=A0A5A8C4J8_CAFRO|nr:hypothetical protein FNF29_07032 [Cafeteria roenbergensis]|eukprot:KAA0147943.1 hypothetical protein FNF29_07032 [Cafeteria roenbergensis]